MVPLTPDGIYSITRNVPGKPDWILDARTEQPRAFFIPAIPASNQTLAASTMQQSDRTSR
jgi:hypothetical protein